MGLVLCWNRKAARATVTDEAPGLSARVLFQAVGEFLPGTAPAAAFLALLSQNLVKRDAGKVDAQVI
jgi:hypothetical protein